jgi:hypothetical protein
MDFKIVLEPGEKHLRQVGPMVPATWMVTPQQQRQLQARGQAIPNPVSGHLLLDTGAGHLMIEIDVARDLKLPDLGKTQAHGISGTDEFDEYEAILLLPVIPIKNPQPIPVSVGFPVQCPATNLQEHHKNYKTVDGKPLRLVGVLGRTFLQFTRMYYDGIKGTVELYLDQSAMQAKKGQPLF